ncbi:MAG: aminoglycoside phosphotransferase family protein [Dehalococcoidia bacterium]
MPKPSLSEAEIVAAVQGMLPGAKTSLFPLAEGEECQAYGVNLTNRRLVVRVHPERRLFDKDLFAFERFSFTAVPVPEVLKIESVEGLWFCLTQFVEGETVQDASPATVENLLDEMVDVMRAIWNVPAPGVGFGDFDPDGSAPYVTWQDYLQAMAENHDWELIANDLELPGFRGVLDRYLALAAGCPEERVLVHGDSGSNNVLTDGKRITAVIDWGDGMYGDPLYDVATARFWQQPPSFPVHWQHYRKVFAGLAGFEQRSLCYALHVGLGQVQYHWRQGDRERATWAGRRCLELLASR